MKCVKMCFEIHQVALNCVGKCANASLTPQNANYVADVSEAWVTLVSLLDFCFQVMRAVRPVLAGQQITISYLGREDFSPASARNSALQERYGFTCSCPRCTLESSLPEATRASLLRIHQIARSELQPALLEAVTGCEAVDDSQSSSKGHERDEVAIAAVGQSVKALCVELETILAEFVTDAKLKLQQIPRQGNPTRYLQQQQQQSSSSRASADLRQEDSLSEQEASDLQQQLLYLQSTVYDLFELMYLHAEVTGEDSSLPLSLAASVVAVNPGSELQVWQSCKQLASAMQAVKQQAAQTAESVSLPEVTQGTNVQDNQTRGQQADRELMHKEKSQPAVSEGMSSAASEVGEAHFLRYGRLPGPLLRKLVAANTALCREYL